MASPHFRAPTDAKGAVRCYPCCRSTGSRCDARRSPPSTHSTIACAIPRRRPGPDWWAAQADRFRERTRAATAPDSFLQAVLPQIRGGMTVLDVGAGTSRYALPLARAGAQVIAIDSSPRMLGHLQQDAAAASLPLTTILGQWEDADVPEADVAICAHVLYAVADAEPFLRKLDACARRCIVLLNYESPAAWMAPLWRAAYGEDRLPLPGAIAALGLLHQLGIDAQLTPIPITTSIRYEGINEALHETRGRLCLAPDATRDRRLRETLTEILEQSPDGGLRVPLPPHSAMIEWNGTPA